MLRKLTADDSRFKTLDFTPGLNIVVADTTSVSAATDSRNSAGKSSIIELLHFLLGARPDKHLATKKALRGIRFRLHLDWPGVPDTLRVTRIGTNPNAVELDHDVTTGMQGQLDFGTTDIPLSEWNQLIEAALFGLKDEHDGISGRNLLSYYIRRVSSHAFNEPIRTHARQTEVVAASNLAYLLGLDWRLATRYREISAREATRTQLRKAVNDPVWGRIVGNTAELRGQITVAEARITRLREQIDSFRVVPEYENLKQRADAISKEIRRLTNEDVVDRRNLQDLESAIRETNGVEVDYVERVYQELGVVLSNQVRRRFEDVRAFHESVVRNRHRYLSDEISTVQRQLEGRRIQRERLGDEQAQILRQLDEGGALEALTVLQRVYAQEQASLDALRNRLAAAQALEASARQITAMRVQIEDEMAADLEDRATQSSEATLLFDQFAKKLYGEQRAGYLAIEAGRNSLKITPRIDDDDSRGIGSMVIFCFDLTLAVIARRHNRGPDFLVHDSHLFDGVDDRQLKAAFELAEQVSREEGLQYIATINSDDLGKAQRRGFDSSPYELTTRLTDAYEDGGLFGFRF
ncbi:hypothetical protein GCM10009733_072470 [Nonomuraea maheshkhaliensis]|uniref:DUF2326 domain-containing protein n=1 Tax=Nonomuraea maheshkhaliensis TaxID=419590 RepID=A0ABN2G2J9_9ACTN